MPRRKYTPSQAAALKHLESIHEAHKVAKATLRRRIEQEFADRLNDFELKKSRAMNEALDLGVAKSDMGRVLGTSHWATLNELISRTADDFKPADFNSVHQALDWDEDSRTVIVTREGRSLTYDADLRPVDLDAAYEAQTEGYGVLEFFKANRDEIERYVASRTQVQHV
jgi:hypothetical protein